MTKTHWKDEVLAFWFEELTAQDWFGGGDDVDAAITLRFMSVWEELHTSLKDAFCADLETLRAAIILFDQFPRNLFRGTAKAFASDPLALSLTKVLLENGWDKDLSGPPLQFALLPLMHSEQLADQELCVSLFNAHLPAAAEFATSHRDMIARFGRFPHRNSVLGRESSAEEREAVAAGNAW